MSDITTWNNDDKRCTNIAANVDELYTVTDKTSCANGCAGYAYANGYTQSFCCSYRSTGGECKISPDGDTDHTTPYVRAYASIRGFIGVDSPAPQSGP